MPNHTDVEMMVNAEGDVGIFMPPVKVAPDSCDFSESVVTVSGKGEPLARFHAPGGFTDALRQASELLVIECLPTRTTRETIIKLG